MDNYPLIKLISSLFQIYNILIFARIMSSWFRMNQYGQIYGLIYKATEPVLGPFRNLFNSLGLLGSGIDFSPMAAIFALNYIQRFIIRALLN